MTRPDEKLVEYIQEVYVHPAYTSIMITSGDSGVPRIVLNQGPGCDRSTVFILRDVDDGAVVLTSEGVVEFHQLMQLVDDPSRDTGSTVRSIKNLSDFKDIIQGMPTSKTAEIFVRSFLGRLVQNPSMPLRVIQDMARVVAAARLDELNDEAKLN